MQPTLAHRIVVVLNEYEWEFENALVETNGATVDIWYEDEDGSRERIATAPANACFIEWVDLEELGGVEVEVDEEEDQEDDHHHHHHSHEQH